MASIRGSLKRGAGSTPVQSPLYFTDLFRQHEELKGLKANAAATYDEVITELRTVIAQYREMQAAHSRAMQTRLAAIDDDINAVVAEAVAHIKTMAPMPVDEAAIVQRLRGMIRQPEDGKSVDEAAVLDKLRAYIPPPVIIDHKKIAKEVVKLVPVATPPTLEEILEGIKKHLTVEHIPGLKNEITSYRSQLAGKKYGVDTWVRGGGDIVLAGTNVTISDVAGKKVISASGGSGFTTLDATETPDGNITVFTFSLASAKPTYIVADGVWTKATGKNGQVNWTWNAGAKKATMNVAPLSDIYAVV